jgi:hypothetical protein
MTDVQIKHMVDRFLTWRLPKDFNPDAGIRYTRPNYGPDVDATPSGTNLLSATQAEAMVRHMIDGVANEGLPQMSHVEHVYIMLLQKFRNFSAYGAQDKATCVDAAIRVFEEIWPDDCARCRARFGNGK